MVINAGGMTAAVRTKPAEKRSLAASACCFRGTGGVGNLQGTNKMHIGPRAPVAGDSARKVDGIVCHRETNEDAIGLY